MQTTVLSSSQKEIRLSITESDIGMLYIIQHELLQNNDISFAGVIVKHPLTKECTMRISTDQGNPVEAVTKAVDSANNNMDDLKRMFSSIREG